MLRFLRRQSVRWVLLLGLCELMLLALSLSVATYLRYFRSPDELAEFSVHMPERALVFGSVIVMGMVALGQYQSHMRTSRFGLLARQAVAFALGGTLLVIGYYVVPQAYVGRGVLAIALSLGFALVLAFRLAFLRLVDVNALKRRVLILGAGLRAAQIHNQMRRRTDRRGFCVVGYVPRMDEPVAVPNEHLMRLNLPLQLIVQREQIDEVVVGVDDRRGHLPMDDLLECRQMGVTITDLTTFFERESGRVQLTILDP